ncbi:MAG: hypothetical protein A2234_02770 [Elusimicrobia bacterium RIFOXYA2_FULL_58_8]|nr:MAG: hypothetical protein A2234_02770 [Elusimicrobia bacterium RIFOXYA2_FULL_58_8]
MLRSHAATGNRAAAPPRPGFTAHELWLLAILLALYLLLPAMPGVVNWPRPYDAGENWFYANLSRDFDNYWFPCLPVLLATLKYHLPQWLMAPAQKLVFLPLVALSFSAGALIHSRRAGSLAAGLSALLLYFTAVRGGVQYEQFIEQVLQAATLLALLCAFAAEFNSELVKQGLCAVAFTAAVWAKGIVAPLLPVFIVLQARAQRSFKKALRRYWLLLAIPAAVTLVWSLLNLFYRCEFTVLEGPARAGSNIAMGALGFISTVEGDWRGAAGIGTGENAFFWAVAQVAAHPLRFLQGIAGRLYFLLVTEPLLPGMWVFFLFGALGAFRLRKLPRARPMALVTGYILGIYLLMPVEGRYFLPFWCLLCCLSAIVLADLIKKEDAAAEWGAGRAAFIAAAAPLLALWGFSFLLLVTFPVRAGFALTGHEARIPSPWVQTMLAERAMEEGDFDSALARYHEAYDLENISWRRARYAKAAFRKGSVRARSLERYIQNPGWDYDVMFLAGLKYLEEGEVKKGGELLSAAMKACVPYRDMMRSVSTPEEAVFASRLEARGREVCAGEIKSFTAALSDRRRNKIGALLPRACLDCVWHPAGL